ncbi:MULTISPECIES: LSm family protein [unclassified Paenibacillus]|uniref:LSm family protein n=1 Tax=unclassified Paenibacillus TaxID=185978 RepID=UPI0004F85832|nr:LSm family protein [Paenibacillus sp. FSL R5-0345]AIQ36532.1 cellobiose phosphorylase [Paenibacillus sp. FSL R5-0345]
MEAYYNCLRCKDKRVRILTRDGRQHEGVITDVDRYNVYLRTDNGSVHTSAFWGNPFAANQILTLSLFTLLAIALI